MLAKLKRLGWFATVAALMGSAMYAGCEVTQGRWGCAIVAGIVMVATAAVLVAAELQGKQGTGIETVPEYFDIACRRVEEAVRKREAAAAQLTLATGTA